MAGKFRLLADLRHGPPLTIENVRSLRKHIGSA
jgi:hypothetical protein